MTTLWISPHLDDAVLSGAARIARDVAHGERVVVATLFTSGGDGRAMTEIYERRRFEDAAALESLGAECVHLSMLDAPARRGIEPSYETLIFAATDPPEVSAAATAIEATARASKATRILLPLGVGGHVDHRTAYETASLLPYEIAFYEERPYAKAPFATELRLAQLGGIAYSMTSAFAGFTESRIHAQIVGAFSELPHLRAYGPDTREARERAAKRHLELARSPAGTARLALRPEILVGTVDELRSAIRAIECYASQITDLFGSREAIEPWLTSFSERFGVPYAERIFVRD